MGEKRKGKGVVCDACHKEAPPNRKVTTDTCPKCHGDQARLANCLVMGRMAGRQGASEKKGS